MSRATVCFSMYSDMSTRIIARSSSKRNSASARASSVLPTPVGPRERNEPMGRVGGGAAGAVGSGETGPRAPDRVGHGAERLVLADDAAAEALFHVDELLDLALEQPRDRDARPLGDGGGDVPLVELLA